MLDKEQILENHKRRIKRAGPHLWYYLITLPKLMQDVTGEKALEICNIYGLRMTDLMLFLDICGCKYDFDKWYKLKFEQEERSKNTIQCNAKNH